MAFVERSKTNWDDKFTREVKVTATGSGAISETLTPLLDGVACDFKLVQVELHMGGDATTSENFTVALDALAGAAYDGNLHEVNVSLEDDPATVVLVANPLAAAFVAGDTIDFAFTNTQANTWGLTVTYRVK